MWRAGFDTPHVQWDALPEPPPEISEVVNYMYLPSPGIEKKTAFDPRFVNMSLYAPLVMVDIVPPKIFKKGDISHFPSDAENIVMTSNRGVLNFLCRNRRYAAFFNEWGIPCKLVPACTFEFLFKPSSAVVNMYSSFWHDIGTFKPGNRVAINFRAGDSFFLDLNEKFARNYILLKYFTCASQISAHEPNEPVLWYFTSESLAIRKFVVDALGFGKKPGLPQWLDLLPRNKTFKLIVDTETEYWHGSCQSMVFNWTQLSTEQRREACPADRQNLSIVHAVGQFHAISLCDYHVYSGSGFPRHASAVGNGKTFWGTEDEHRNFPMCNSSNVVPYENIFNKGNLM